MVFQESLKLVHFLTFPIIFVFFSFNNNILVLHALHIGVQAFDSSVTLSNKECSRTCESDFCSVPPLLKYGKYCGLLYSGCPGEIPCDGLDACCMDHDACIQSKDNEYLSQECSQDLLDCMDNVKKSKRDPFKGNTCHADEVIHVISTAMEAALVAGRFLNKP